MDAARLSHDTHLDYFVADSPVECHRDHLLVGRHAVKVLSMKEPPSQTFAHHAGGPGGGARRVHRLSRVAADRASDRMRRDIQTRRRHFFNKRVSLVNYVSPETRPEEMLVDDSATRHGAAAR